MATGEGHPCFEIALKRVMTISPGGDEMALHASRRRAGREGTISLGRDVKLAL